MCGNQELGDKEPFFYRLVVNTSFRSFCNSESLDDNGKASIAIDPAVIAAAINYAFLRLNYDRNYTEFLGYPSLSVTYASGKAIRNFVTWPVGYKSYMVTLEKTRKCQFTTI